jgi:hypothetical protein
VLGEGGKERRERRGEWDVSVKGVKMRIGTERKESAMVVLNRKDDVGKRQRRRSWFSFSFSFL